MALTSAGKENDKSKKDKKKKKKDKDKHASVSLLGGAGRGAKMAANFYPPLRKGSGRGMSLDNHVEDGLLNKHRDHRIRRQQSQPERSACFNCLRNALHCYNIVVLILGVGALAVGVWLLVTDFSAREVTVLVDSDFFEIGTYLVLAGGGLIALLAFCGCCGTMREDRCILGFGKKKLKYEFLCGKKTCMKRNFQKYLTCNLLKINLNLNVACFGKINLYILKQEKFQSSNFLLIKLQKLLS
ncbi:hypothetical protein KUTeg_016798 [Tegillarca granosa]|uniref:Tetraspanin n=1 Tax=Tegillarca granosa TaxID=220873 RepID=A0ABQ9ESK7_TEGGR|nr:hypothetical protein KUTeg_016798 [Tegillarca granosa]